MPGDLKIDTLLDALVLLVPAALALTLIVLLIVKRSSRRKAPEVAPKIAKEAAYAIPQPVVAAPRSAVEALEARPLESTEVITAKIEQALVDGSKLSLSGLYFDLAAALGREGNGNARMSALRSAAGYGALHGPPSAHAAARMALAEESYQAGDLTSACEQWQLARTAFLDGGDTEQHAHVEKRMRDNGCPTDWVLTDF